MINDGGAASPYFDRSLVDATAIRDTIQMVNARLGQTWAAHMDGQREASLRFLAAGEALAIKARDTVSQSYLRSERARQTFIAGAYKEAITQYRQAIALHQRYNHEQDIQTDYLGLVRCYLELGWLTEAQNTIVTADELVRRAGGIHKQRETAELYAVVAEASGDLPLALQQHKRIQMLYDSINEQAAQGSLRREEIRQNVAEYRAENESLQREGMLLSQRSRLYLALAATLLLLVLVGGFLLWKLRATRRRLAASNEKLLALNRTKDRFFGIIAHDLRSPLVSLDSVGDQIRFYLDRGREERARDLADHIGGTAKRLSRLLDQLLNWALLQQGTMPHHPEPLLLAEIVEEVVDLFEPTATAKGIQLTHVLPTGLTLRADPAGLRTILRNLLSNAIKFTPSGGKVRITAESSAARVFLIVSDDGIGMEEERLRDILREGSRSTRGTAGERGSGLGLRLVRELAELHGADISATSQAGAGTRFTLIFPA